MMPEYIASKLALLPQFEVQSLGRRTGEYGRLTLLSGYFSEDVGNDENGAYLYLPDLRFLDGLLLAATEGDFLRTIEVSGYSWSHISERVIVGTTLAFFGAHDSRHLELVIEPESNWTKAEFKPQKAIQSYIIGTDGKSYRKLSEFLEGIELKDGESIVEGAWDHEHCLFCSRTIDSDKSGFNSGPDLSGDWACEWCYRNAVEPRDPRPLLIPYVDRVS